MSVGRSYNFCVGSCKFSALTRLRNVNELLAPRYSPVPGLSEKRPLAPEVEEVAAGSSLGREPPEVKGSGYVVGSLELGTGKGCGLRPAPLSQARGRRFFLPLRKTGESENGMELDRVRSHAGLAVLEVEERDPSYDGIGAKSHCTPGSGHLAPPSRRCPRCA